MIKVNIILAIASIMALIVLISAYTSLFNTLEQAMQELDWSVNTRQEV